MAHQIPQCLSNPERVKKPLCSVTKQFKTFPCSQQYLYSTKIQKTSKSSSSVSKQHVKQLCSCSLSLSPYQVRVCFLSSFPVFTSSCVISSPASKCHPSSYSSNLFSKGLVSFCWTIYFSNLKREKYFPIS